MQIYVDNAARRANQQHSTSETEINFLEIIDTSNEKEHDDSLETMPKQIQVSETLDNNETEIVHVRESDKSTDFVDSHVSDQIFENSTMGQLDKDVWHVAKQVEHLHEKLDQFGGNDVGNKISVQEFKDSFRSLLTTLNKENPSIRIIVGGLLPREGVHMTDHNQCLIDLCGEMHIDFINHIDSYVLRNGKLIPGILYPDGVHLTMKGTSRLIHNMNDVAPILANTYTENGREKSNLNFGFQKHFHQRNSTNRNLYSQRATHEVHSKFESQSRQQNSQKSCFNCGETNHSQVSCTFKQIIRCYSCHEIGHKQKLCRKQYITDTQGYRQLNGPVPFNYMYAN
ncbi:CNBP [Mytilus coruscus]|uniref:CNBP n=1 Tax=Mytilus coruscus TaxID=42192 RepID=A0A6J8E369_MYTCO|nr:CNBP [Mytilus coruscus]